MSEQTHNRLPISDNALKVLERRYLKRDDNGIPTEQPEALFDRVAAAIALGEKKVGNDKTAQEKWKKLFLEMMRSFEFMPNSPTLMNAGRDLGQLSACFVLPIDDSMESIFETIKNTALIHKSGGGTGFSFSRLRPKNSIVKSTSGVASGPVSFLRVFNAATEAVKQGGTRRGANMGILRVDHPDIIDFITCKQDNAEITNFNISVAITDDFMEKVKADEKYALVNPKSGAVEQMISAKEVFDLIVENAWANGDPGVVFIDKINEDNVTPRLGVIEATNPCGEQPLLPYEACNLGSINLDRMVTNGRVDYGKLARLVNQAVRFLDDVIEVNKFPLPEIDEMVRNNRKIGLGAMGFADMLFQMNIAYNSEEGVELAEEVMRFIYDEAKKASYKLAEERGTFPNFDISIYKENALPKIRNATVVTIAPTGTISMICDCSSGIEPLFSIVYTKTVMDGTHLFYANKHFEKVARERGFYSDELMERISEAGTVQTFDEVPDDVKKVFVVASDISPYWHVKMQSAFQKYTDDAVSKTVNFPSDATVDEVREVYMLSYDMGCKGVTIFRDGCRGEQVLTRGIKKDGEAAPLQSLEPALSRPRPRPEVIQGSTSKIGTGCGNLYVTINQDDDGSPFEMFSQMGKAGGCAASQLEAIGRLVSLALRSGIALEAVMEQLRGIRCPEPSWEKGMRIFSCADAISRVIEKRVGDDDQTDIQREPVNHSPHSMNEEKMAMSLPQAGVLARTNVIGVCPDCGAALRHEEGCASCRACGYSRC